MNHWNFTLWTNSWRENSHNSEMIRHVVFMWWFLHLEKSSKTNLPILEPKQPSSLCPFGERQKTTCCHRGSQLLGQGQVLLSWTIQLVDLCPCLLLTILGQLFFLNKEVLGIKNKTLDPFADTRREWRNLPSFCCPPHFIHGFYELFKYAYEYPQLLSFVLISRVHIIQNLQGTAKEGFNMNKIKSWPRKTSNWLKIAIINQI